MNTSTLFKLFVVVVILNILDVASTWIILNNGGRELNPIGAFAMNLIGPLPAMLIMKALITALLYWSVFVKYVDYKYNLQILVVLIVAYVFVVGNNINVIHNMVLSRHQFIWF